MAQNLSAAAVVIGALRVKYVIATNCCLLSLLNVKNNVLDDNVTQCTDPSRFTEVNITNKWYLIRLLLLEQSDLGLLCLLMIFLSA